MWQKYWAVFEHAFIQAIYHRAELITWLILDTVPTLMLFFVWQKIFEGTTEIKGYTLATMIQYYFFYTVINNITSSHFEQKRCEEIRLGKIDLFLTRPLSYVTEIFFNFLGSKGAFLIFTILTSFVIYWASERLFHIQFPSISLWQALQFALLLLISVLIQFLIALIIVLLSFWIEGAEGLEHFKWIIITVLGGSIIPRTFMPETLRRLIDLFPFQFMYAVPIDILQGFHTLTIGETLYASSFVIFLALTSKIIWQRAKLRYSSAGG